MVDGLFFCATLIGRSGSHIPFVQTEAEMPDTGAEAVKPNTGSSSEGRSGVMDTGVWDENADLFWVVCPLRIPLVMHPGRRTYVVVRWTDEMLCGR